MRFSLPTTFVTILWASLVKTHENHNELDLIFQERSQSDWQNLWHQERYSRCRENIEKHLNWACEKDIYRLKRVDPNLEQPENDIFLSPAKALTMFNIDRRLSKRAGHISKECCSAKGCTWEEYAEYCTHNNRKLPSRGRISL